VDSCGPNRHLLFAKCINARFKHTFVATRSESRIGFLLVVNKYKALVIYAGWGED